MLLPLWPLEGIVGVFGGDGEEGLPVGGVVAFRGAEIDGAGDVAFVGVTASPSVTPASLDVLHQRSYLCTRCC